MPAKSGHGVVIYVTLDPETSPTVFTAIDELVGDQTFKTTRASKKVTPHSRNGASVTVDEYVVSNEKVRDEMTLRFNFDPDNEDHIALRELMFDQSVIGLEKLGPGGVINTSMSIRQSGELTSWTETMPQFEGEMAYEFTFRPSGPFNVDGELRS